MDMEIRENEAENKRKRMNESINARAKSMSKEELIEETQRMRTVDPNFKPLDDEMDNYVHKHGVLDFSFDDYGVLILFPPINKEKYAKEVNKNKYKQNQFSKYENVLYTNYYLNRPSSLKDIEKIINTIENESLYPFKINMDLGFIVENTNEKKYSKTYPEPGNRRFITCTMHSKENIDNYFQYVLSYISKKMELTHEGSANLFIGIYSIYFQVTHIQPDKKNNFEVEDVLIGAASEVPVYFKNSKNIMSGFSKLGK